MLNDDNSSKIQKTTMGLVTGAGFAPLLDVVKSRLATEQITNTDTVLSIIKEETDKIRQNWKTYYQVDAAIEQTGWIFTYVTTLNNHPLLRVACFHPRLCKENCAIYGEGEPAIIYPVELDREAVEAIHDPILQRIKIPKDLSEVESSIGYNSRVIGALIDVLQLYCPSISRRFQIGIHSYGQAGISDLIDIKENGTFNFNIKMESI